MKNLFLHLLRLSICIVLLPIQVQLQQRECYKTFRVQGVDKNGQQQDFSLTLKRFLVDFDQATIDTKEIDDEKLYRGWYTLIPGKQPSRFKSCAGYVLDALYNTGDTALSVSDIHTKIIDRFLEREITSGSVQKGDVVIFGTDIHIAIVTGAGTTGRFSIASKDNEGTPVEGIMDTSRGNDPIIRRGGKPRFYRLKPVSVVEYSPGVCDVDLKVIIDVNEILLDKLRPLEGVAVALELKSGKQIPLKPTSDKGETEYVFSNSAPEQLGLARQGLKVITTKTGFTSQPNEIPANMLTVNERRWTITMSRTPDNPPEKDKTLPPDIVRHFELQAWQKRLDALIGKLIALEGRRTKILTQLNSARTNAQKVIDAQKKLEELLKQLKDQTIKDAVGRAKSYCEQAVKLNQSITAAETKITGMEKQATTLSDEIIKLAEACTSQADIINVRQKRAALKKLVDEMTPVIQQAQADNKALQTLQQQYLAELTELKKIVDLRNSFKTEKAAADKALGEALKSFQEIIEPETKLGTDSSSLQLEFIRLKDDYPVSPPPDDIKKMLDAIEARILKAGARLSDSKKEAELTQASSTIVSLETEAKTLIEKEYQPAVCPIRDRDETLKTMAGSLTFAGLSLHVAERTEDLLKKCDLQTYCAEKIALIEKALSIGDLETSTTIIIEIKARGCNTYEVEQKWLKVQERIFDLLARAQLSWRDIDTHCNYQSAYDAAKALEKQFPKHPWLVKNLPDIERGWRADQQIKQFTQQLIVADKNRNYAEAERLIAEVDKVAKPFPCLVKEAQRLRAEYLRGKPASPELEKECQALIAGIEQAIAAGKLADAAQKLEIAQKRCGTVSPALFAKLKGLPQQLNAAAEQIPTQAEQSIGKCEYEAAYELALELQKINPAHPWLAMRMNQLRDEADAQKKARQFLRPGLEAIQRKDINGAIASLKQAQEVQGVPACLADQIRKLRKDMEGRRDFMQLTEKVQLATRECDYAGAEALMKQIRAITPREQYITDWLATNEPIIQELQERKRRALALIDAAEKTVAQAEAECQQDPANWDRVTALVKQAIETLDKADQEAPKCLPERKRMEELRRRLAEVANRRKTNIAVSIVLLIDTSGSMGQNNKIENAKAAARAAVRNASKTTEIAVMHFDGGCGVGAVRTASDFTTNVNQLLQAIDTLKPGGGTPMYIATAVAVEYAKARVEKRLTKSAIVVLMSDGGDTCRGDQAKAAASISTSNIPVNTIGYDVGGDQNAVKDLSNLAAMTNGRNYSATTADPKEIVNAFKIALLPSLFKDFDVAGGSSAVQSHFDMAKTAVKQQDLNGATFQLQQAQRLAPDSPAVSYNLALVNEANDKPLAAIRSAENYLRLAPNALDRADVEGRIEQMRKEAQQNPRAEYDPAACRDVYNWALIEREAAKRAGNPARLQTVLEIQIAAQRGDCAKARQMQERYRQQFP
jgi:Mg-chelatase subunit ChlD